MRTYPRTSIIYRHGNLQPCSQFLGRMPDPCNATCGQALNLSRNGYCYLNDNFKAKDQCCYVRLFNILALRFERFERLSSCHEHWPITPDFRRLYLTRLGQEQAWLSYHHNYTPGRRSKARLHFTCRGQEVSGAFDSLTGKLVG